LILSMIISFKLNLYNSISMKKNIKGMYNKN
jgi:hypothetical protein